MFNQATPTKFKKKKKCCKKWKKKGKACKKCPLSILCS